MKAFVAALDEDALFESGVRTAGAQAAASKTNQQAKAGPEALRIVQQVKDELVRRDDFQRFAVPAQIGRVMISRYEAGMHYGSHFDEAFIDGVRTDLSFTLFLSEPESYTGGELALHSPAGSQAIKLPAGCAIVYPSDQMHEVLPIESGVRLAVVGWVQSRIKSTAERMLQYELGEATHAIAAGSDLAAVELKLKMVRNNLLRLWSS
ncbi:MAG: Fe2+-dependent dioxygenase [Pseudomonadota bacterium]